MPDGTELILHHRRGVYQIRVDGYDLMSSRAHGSEDRLATSTCSAMQAASAPSVLVGGLGLGYSLRAALDVLPSDSRVQVVEAIPAVIEWNRRFVGRLAAQPLDDPRVTVVAGDIFDILNEGQACWDAIVLDVDNGPEMLSRPVNSRLYSTEGLGTIRDALRVDGILGLWSPDPNPALASRLTAGGYIVATEAVPAGPDSRSPTHHLYIARRSI